MPELIHPTAIIDPSAQIASNVRIGAYSIIGANVEIAAGTIVAPHVVISGPTFIGENNHIFQFSSIGDVPQDKKYAGEDTQLLIGNDNVIRENVTINRGTVQGGGKTELGDGNLLMAYVHVAHDCIIGNNNILANNVALAGHVTIHHAAILGGYSLIHQFCTIGEHAFTAMNSVITKDIPPYLMVSSLDSRPRGLNFEGMRRHEFSDEAVKFLKQAYKLLYKSKLSLQQSISEISELPFNVPQKEKLLDFLNNHLQRGLIR